MDPTSNDLYVEQRYIADTTMPNDGSHNIWHNTPMTHVLLFGRAKHASSEYVRCFTGT